MSLPPPAPVTKAPQVQSPLTLVMPLKSAQHAQALRQMIEGLAAAPVNPIEVALEALGSVHFARFVLLENDTRLAVITSYDGDFERYVMDFVDHLGPEFDELLAAVADWPADQPVQEHRDAFLDYVRAHDLRCVGSFYSAYPELPAIDIVGLRPGAE